MRKMFTMSRLHTGVVVFSIAAAFMFYAYSTGITGKTKKNGAGCTCHGSANSGVTVAIAGPETLQVNQSGQYTVTVSGGPLSAAGTNIAASSGLLSAAAGLQKIGDELTHTAPKAPNAGSVTFQFSYTAPSSPASVTLYATGNSVNLSSDPDGDAWNHAPNKTVTVLTVVPVELTSFTAAASADGISLRWTTATEINNKGFYVERRGNALNWTRLGFVAGNGTISTPSEYVYADKNIVSGTCSYRLVQVDFNGTQKEYYLGTEVSGAAPAEFALRQNYPNPFNPSTNIAYSIPSEGFVTLKVYSVAGELVATPVSGIRAAGNYSEAFSAKGLTSGIYFYTLEVRGASSAIVYAKTAKMILSK